MENNKKNESKLETFDRKLLEQQKAYRKVYIKLFTGLIVGLILFLVPFAFDLYTKWQNQPVIDKYLQTAEQAAENLPSAKAYNKQIIKYQAGKEEKPEPKKVFDNFKAPVGYLTIPAIKLDKMVFYFGESEWVLNHGTGILDWGSLPTGGKNTKSVITGHSGLANQIYFDNIRHLKNGDMIYVNSFNQKMAYKVYQQKVIDPNDKTKLKTMYVEKDKDVITLLTCTPLFINSHRLLVFAKRVPLKEAKKAPVTRRDIFSLDHIWMFVVIGLVLLLILWFMIQRIRYKRAIKEIEKKLVLEDLSDENS